MLAGLKLLESKQSQNGNGRYELSDNLNQDDANSQESRITNRNRIQREGKHKKNRLMRLAVGGAMLMLTPKKGGIVNTLTRAVGGALVIYGVTGWDPLSVIKRSSDDYMPV
ncbi:MAG: hypothetical protein VKJ04_07175 [Vampirovibrionales bacterium]|nr:hypothetical protein [Vampirovibrionales bacterium]